jgi:hypothetical protein
MQAQVGKYKDYSLYSQNLYWSDVISWLNHMPVKEHIQSFYDVTVMLHFYVKCMYKVQDNYDCYIRARNSDF